MDAFLPPVAKSWRPHAYQKAAVKFCVGQGAAGLFLDPGLGKTSITLATFKVLKAQGLVKRMLVIAPLRPAYSVWPGEIARWADFNKLSWSILHGEGKGERLTPSCDEAGLGEAFPPRRIVEWVRQINNVGHNGIVRSI